MFDADKPIVSSQQDRLGRAVFAKYLARCLLDHASPESMVVGLSGPSGSGKTSVINMMLEELQIASNHMFDHEKPIILNFSPWSYSGQKQLIYSFFRRLSAEMRRSDYLENSERIIYLLELYISFFTHQPVPRILRTKGNWWHRLLNPKTADAVIGWESGRDLTLVKAELNELLRKQKHKIIVVIDNIGRVKNEEVGEIFQIAKSIGDFCNTIYLLAYDKERVLKAVETFHSDSKGFLEKVVQLPFQIPLISTQDLSTILLSRLKNIIALAPQDSWHASYWMDLYDETLKKFFVTCRDITRYVNTLGFSFSRVKDVVNPMDFFALTALEVFEPNVYFGLRDNKDLFADLVNNVYTFSATSLQTDRIRCDEIICRSEKISQEEMRALLMHLFPRLRHIYHQGQPFYHDEQIARKNHRICSADMFDVYFRLSLPIGFISVAELNAILSLADNQAALTEALLRLNHDEKARKLLDLLDYSVLQKIPKTFITNVVGALMDVVDLIPEGENNRMYLNTPMRVSRILHTLLMRLDTPEQRFLALKSAILQTNKSLSGIIYFLHEEMREHIETDDVYRPIEHRDLTTQQLTELQNAVVEKIKNWAEINRLAEHPKLLTILMAWKLWGDGEECLRAVETMVTTDRGLTAFLMAALQRPIDAAMIQLKKDGTWENDLKNIEMFIPVMSLAEPVRQLFESATFEKLAEREQWAILIFLDLAKIPTNKIIPKTTA